MFWPGEDTVVRPAGLEPATFGSGGQRSIQLSYGRETLIIPRREPVALAAYMQPVAAVNAAAAPLPRV
jgi:hypothetical protein